LEDLISSEEMAIIDENTNYLGIPTSLLMENAGRELARVVQSKVDMTNKSVIIFAGTGNNGGDSFVLARHISRFANQVQVVLIGDSSKIKTPESKLNWAALLNMEFSIKISIIQDSSELKNLKIGNPDIIIDGLLGTGVQGKIREPIASAINLINSLEGVKVAVDIPSGMNPDTGVVEEIAVKADYTITFHKIKQGLVENKEYSGEIIPVSIGIPPEAEFIVGPGDLRFVIKKRPAESHKGDFGKILVVGGGGGNFYSGAPTLAGLAALITGADLVNIAAPSSVSSTIRNYSPDLIVRDLPGNYLSESAIEPLEPLLEWATAIIIGPGLGLESETIDTILVILEKIHQLKTPVVVDADAIKAMAGNKEILKRIPAVITPHFGEFKILTGIDLISVTDSYERLQVVRNSAKEFGMTFLVKGKDDLISDGQNAKMNRTHTSAMTVGGTGDVLSGIVGCLLGQNYPPFRAANAAAFINGLAGKYAEKRRYGPHIVATDLLKFIPKAMRLS
jgi:NAD(P)H-hydrate epimerase